MIPKNKYQRVIFLSVSFIVIGIIGYVLFNYTPPVNPKVDRIAFIAWSSYIGLLGPLREDIYVMNVDSPGLTQIHQSNIGGGLTWSPQGDKFVFYRSGSLYTVNADGSAQPELVQPQPELVQQGIFVTDMVWSPDRSHIVFSNGAGKLYILDITKKQVTPLLDDAVKGDQPDWSPDSTKVVFLLLESHHDGIGRSIAVVNKDGSGLIELTPKDNITSPRWSPDGLQILFERDGNIYVMNTDGSNVRALTQDGENWSPSWSPDGQRIAFVSAANERCGPGFADVSGFCTNELRVMNADGSNVAIIRNKNNERVITAIWAPRN